ncbi:MAG: hypothetical protein ACON4T_08295 [Synechococcus sp.]
MVPPPGQRGWWLSCRPLVVTLLLIPFWIILLLSPTPAAASPGLCTGPVCADGITRSAKNHWQLVLRLEDQQGHHEKVVMDCRAGVLSPRAGLVDRGYASALGLRLCRYASEAS